ncbi:MAG: hypothetical protein ACYDGL_12565 [Bellilinea sp.]
MTKSWRLKRTESWLHGKHIIAREREARPRRSEPVGIVVGRIEGVQGDPIQELPLQPDIRHRYCTGSMSSRGSVMRDRGDLSRLRNALSVERAASLSNQIAAPLRGSQ